VQWLALYVIDFNVQHVGVLRYAINQVFIERNRSRTIDQLELRSRDVDLVKQTPHDLVVIGIHLADQAERHRSSRSS